METITKKVSELIPYVNNPRNNDDAIDAVASSIKNFGFKVPIVVDSNNEIINGHTRLKAAKKLGLETISIPNRLYKFYLSKSPLYIFTNSSI